MESSPNFLSNKKLAFCPKHKSNVLEWVCLEKSCEKRLFCQFCVIYEHKEVHKTFSHITKILSDPLLSFQRLDVVTNELDTLKPQKSDFKTRLADAVKKEEEKLDQLFNGIVLNLSSKFEQLRKSFHDDVGSFLKAKEKELDAVDSTRKDYVQFCEEYFPQLDFQAAEQLKEGIEIVIAKYFGDEELINNLKITQNAIPNIKTLEKYELSLNKRSIADLKWRVFADKEIYLEGRPVYRYNSNKTCGDITFTNDDATVQKKGAYFSSTCLGETVFSAGVYEWEIEINQKEGSYICIGIINTSQEWNLKGDNYTSAHCVCSDGCAYGMDRVDGNLTMNQNDIINFCLDLNEGKLTATGPNNRYVYAATGLKGKEFTAFLGFASGATYRLTMRGK